MPTMPAQRTIIAYKERFTLVARLVLIYWLARFVLLAGWRHVRAKGVLGTGQHLYKKIHGVSYINTIGSMADDADGIRHHPVTALIAP
jgi:hypothetical protein